MALAFPYVRVKKRKDWPAFKKKIKGQNTRSWNGFGFENTIV